MSYIWYDDKGNEYKIVFDDHNVPSIEKVPIEENSVFKDLLVLLETKCDSLSLDSEEDRQSLVKILFEEGWLDI